MELLERVMVFLWERVWVYECWLVRSMAFWLAWVLVLERVCLLLCELEC